MFEVKSNTKTFFTLAQLHYEVNKKHHIFVNFVFMVQNLAIYDMIM